MEVCIQPRLLTFQQVLSLALLISSSIYLSALSDVAADLKKEDINCTEIKANYENIHPVTTTTKLNDEATTSQESNLQNDDYNNEERRILICKIIDHWALYMIIGATCIISSVLSILFSYFDGIDSLASVLTYTIPPGICCVLMFFSSIFSADFMIFLPFLAKSMIATFSLCLPGFLLVCAACCCGLAEDSQLSRNRRGYGRIN